MSNDNIIATVESTINTSKPVTSNNHYSFKAGVEVHNFSPRTIFCCTHDGTIVEVKPSKVNTDQNKIILTNYQTNHTGGTITTPDGHEDLRLNHIRNLLVQGNHYKFEESINLDDIYNQRKGVYHHGSNIAFYRDNEAAKFIGHPLARQKWMDENLILNNWFDPHFDVGVVISYIDNLKESKTIFAIFNDKIFTVKSKPSLTVGAGIWIHGFPELNETDNRIRESVRYTLEEALNGKTPIPFFETLIEAKNIMSIKQSKLDEQKFNELKRQHEKEIEILKQERLRHEHQFTTTELKEKSKHSKKEKQHSSDKLKTDLELLKLKAELEQKQIENKRKSEEYKTIGLFLSAGLMIWKLLS